MRLSDAVKLSVELSYGLWLPATRCFAPAQQRQREVGDDDERTRPGAVADAVRKDPVDGHDA